MASIQRRPARGGRIRYRVQVRLRGEVRSATFPTLQEARQWATITEGTLRTQRVGPTLAGTPGPGALSHRRGTPAPARGLPGEPQPVPLPGGPAGLKYGRPQAGTSRPDLAGCRPPPGATHHRAQQKRRTTDPAPR